MICPTSAHLTPAPTGPRRRAVPRRPARRRRAVVAGLAGLALAATAACTPGDSPAPDPTAETPARLVILRVGPLNTQNTLSMAVRGDALLEPVHEAVRTVGAAGARIDEVASFPAFAPAAEAMAAGQVDMTSGSVTSLVAALEGNPDLVVFAVEVSDGDTQGIVAAPGTGVESIEDLAGRSVAFNEGGTGDYLLRLALEGAGMTVDDVLPVPLSPPEAAAAFATGRVDAWATWDQYLASAELTDGARLVATAADIGATNPTVHVVSREFLREHPEVVAAVYEALVEQADAVVADPGLLEQAYRDAGADDDVAAAVVAKRPPTIAWADEAFADDVAAVARFYAAQGLTPEVVDTGDATVDVRVLTP